MIQVGTQLTIADNSGAKTAQCLKILQKKKKDQGSIGDIIIVSIQDILRKHQTKVKKGQVHKALILETKSLQKRKDGSALQFQRNSAVLLSAQGTPIATRIQGVASYELRYKSLLKVLSLSGANL